MLCEDTDVIFPMKADVYYPIVSQGPYGEVKKRWVLDRIIVCNFSSGGTAYQEDVKPNVNITKEGILIGRVKADLRISETNNYSSITNVIITNIRDKNDNLIYLETSGPRSGKATIYEIATNDPVFGPFNSIDYYKVLIRRSENQATDL